MADFSHNVTITNRFVSARGSGVVGLGNWFLALTFRLWPLEAWYGAFSVIGWPSSLLSDLSFLPLLMILVRELRGRCVRENKD